MKTTKFLTKILLTFAFFFALNTFAQSKMSSEPVSLKKAETDNVVTFLSNSKDHTILVQAVKAADLVETLSGDGPFTVFAPTDAAFKSLPEGRLDMLLKPENKDKLKAILTYHVLSGSFDAKTIVNAISANDGYADFRTVNGTIVSGFVEGGNVFLSDAQENKAKVTKADLQQSNGIIHVIDTVISPE